MGDSRPLPGFGQVDLDIEDDAVADARAPAFGELDWDLGSDDAEHAAEPHVEAQAPASATRGVTFAEQHTKVTRRNLPAAAPPPARVPTTPAPLPVRSPARGALGSVHDESTRIVQGDALSNITRPPPPLEPLRRAGESGDDATRAWADIEANLAALGEDSSRSGAQPAPSESGVATRDARVAAMRDLYARGDAEGALALAATLDGAAPNGVDHPDASVHVVFGEDEISDPFGGLIPVDDDLAARPTVPPEAFGSSSPSSPAAPVLQLSLTERHSIPRLLKSMNEVAKLPIDHRAGFLLAHVDGMQTLEEILDICAMPPVEALDLISRLRDMGVIEFE